MQPDNTNQTPSIEANVKPTVLVQNITVRPASRRTQDIASWRNALKAAEATNPRRVELYDLYDDILLDGHLRSVVGKRIMAVTNADWQFIGKDGKILDQVNDLIDTPEFEEMLTEIMNTRFWGATALEFAFNKDQATKAACFNTYTIPRKHLRPHLGIIAKEQTGDSGINIREGIYLSTVMEVGKTRDLGLLLSAAQYVIYKRGSFGDWAQFTEIFGMPFRKGTYNGFDESQRVQLEEALEKMGSAGWVVLPDGSTIEFIENKTNSDGELFNKLRDACNKELSVLVLGQTETTESSKSSGYAQSKTHAETEEDIQKADRKFARHILNKLFVRILEANGINTQGGRFKIKGEGEEKVSKKERFDMQMRMIKELGLPHDDEFFYEEYHMPKPKDYDKQKAEKQKAADLAVNNAPTPEASKDKTAKKVPAKDKKPVAKPANLTEEGETLVKQIQDAATNYIERLKSFFD